MNKHERALWQAQEAVEMACRAEAQLTHAEVTNIAIAAYLAVMREPGTDEVRGRICCVAGPDGQFLAIGDSALNDDEMREAAEEVDWPTRVTWVEANIPAWRPPAEETVEGEVV